MSPDQARKRTRRLDRDLLVAEAEQAALGWMYMTVEGIDIESEPDLERYLRALDAFGEVAAGRECRYCSTPSRLTFGIRGEAAEESTRGEDASARIAVLHARLDALRRSRNSRAQSHSAIRLPSQAPGLLRDNFRFLARWAMAVRGELGGGYLAGLVRFLVIWQSGGLKGWAVVDPVAGQRGQAHPLTPAAREPGLAMAGPDFHAVIGSRPGQPALPGMPSPAGAVIGQAWLPGFEPGPAAGDGELALSSADAVV